MKCIVRIKLGTPKCTANPKAQTSIDVHLSNHYLPLLEKKFEHLITKTLTLSKSYMEFPKETFFLVH